MIELHIASTWNLAFDAANAADYERLYFALKYSNFLGDETAELLISSNNGLEHLIGKPCDSHAWGSITVGDDGRVMVRVEASATAQIQPYTHPIHYDIRGIRPNATDVLASDVLTLHPTASNLHSTVVATTASESVTVAMLQASGLLDLTHIFQTEAAALYGNGMKTVYDVAVAAPLDVGQLLGFYGIKLAETIASARERVPELAHLAAFLAAQDGIVADAARLTAYDLAVDYVNSRAYFSDSSGNWHELTAP